MMKNMMEYRGYHAKVEYVLEDRCFMGKVFGIVDTLVFDGQTVDELEAMFHTCVDDYLEMCREMGKEPDREFKGSFNVRVTPELHRRAALAAEQQGISLNQYVTRALEAYENGEVTTREVAYVLPISEKRWVAQVQALGSGEFSQTLPKRYSAAQMGGVSNAEYYK